MEQTTYVAGWVDRIDDIAVGMTERALRADGGVAPPTVHFLVDGLDPPYVGYLTSRPMYRGEDAAQALAAMGLVGSMLGASRLVVVDADQGGHEMRWRPVQFHVGPANSTGGPTVRPEWGPGLRYPRDFPLPHAVAGLLKAWRAPRAWSETEFLNAFAAMEVSGYSMRWVTRPAGEREQPSWMRLLAPIM